MEPSKAILTKRSSLIPASDMHYISSSSGVVHSFGSDEKIRFCELLNLTFLKDPDLQSLLPMNPSTSDLFEKVENGLLLCKMVNDAEPNTIDERAINKKQPLNIFQKKENLNLAISAAKSIGCRLVNVNPQLIFDRREHIILGLIWQIVRIKYLAKINLKETPYLLTIKEADEDIASLLKLPPEQLLIRWFNYHLKKSGYLREITNFSSDLKDGLAYTYLLNQINGGSCDKTGVLMVESKRTAKVINDAKKILVETTMTAEEIMNGNPKLNLLFCAQIFNKAPGLSPPSEAVKKEAIVLLSNEDISDSREERCFRLWLNSLNLEININNLFEDLKDGLALLYTIEKIAPNLVDWRKAALKCENKFKKLQNTNYVIELGKTLGFSLVGIGGVDITEGNKKLVLAYVWQLMRKNMLDLIGNNNEEKLLQWAIEKTKKEPLISSFKDKNIRNCRFLLNLLDSFDAGLVDWSAILEGNEEDSVKKNAEYVLSLARKLGATTFLVWEDIKEVRPKMIMMFIASLLEIAKPNVLRKSKTASIEGNK